MTDKRARDDDDDDEVTAAAAAEHNKTVSRQLVTLLRDGRFNPAAFAGWPVDPPGKPAPYAYFADVLSDISSTSGRLECIKILTYFFLTILLRSPQDLVSAVYLVVNKLAPAHEGIELGIGDAIMIKIVAEITAKTEKNVREEYQKVGDLAEMAQKGKKSVKTFYVPKALTIGGVFTSLRQLATTSGKDSAKLKVDRALKLLRDAQGPEVNFLVRAMLGKMRIGVAEPSMLLALSCAICIHGIDGGFDAAARMPIDDFNSRLQSASDNVARLFHECPSLDIIVPPLVTHGLRAFDDAAVRSTLGIRPGLPVKPMLAHPTNSVSSILNRFQGKDFVSEYKYDGERAQIHFDAATFGFRIFSRNSENHTEKYPDVIRVLGQAFNTASSSAAVAPHHPHYDATASTGKHNDGGASSPAVASSSAASSSSLIILPMAPPICSTPPIAPSSGIPTPAEPPTTPALGPQDAGATALHLSAMFAPTSHTNTNPFSPLLPSPSVTAVDGGNGESSASATAAAATVVEIPREQLPPVTSFILDSEVVATDANGNLQNFQTLQHRARKVTGTDTVSVQVTVMVFDVLLLNGETMLNKPLRERREILRRHFIATDKIRFATGVVSNDVDELQGFLEESIKAGCEGLMVKTLDVDAAYTPMKRSHHWLKLKKDYMDGAGDTLDLVPIGAYYGKGKRTGAYGGYLLACYDPESEEFQTVCKIGTGFKDEDLQRLTNELAPTAVPTMPSYFRVHANLTPDVWFSEKQVWEVKAADLTLSPVHTAASRYLERGVALRFPRYLRSRDDKGPTDATTASQVMEMYQAQALAAPSAGAEHRAGLD